MTLKTGKEDYLGIQIDYDKELNLTEFSLATLKDRYLFGDETHAQHAFARASVYGATYKGTTDFDLALLSLVTVDLTVACLSLVFLIMLLIQGVAYLITTMRTYGWRVQVEVLVDIGAILGVMGYLLLTAVSLLVVFLSCM